MIMGGRVLEKNEVQTFNFKAHKGLGDQFHLHGGYDGIIWELSLLPTN